MATIEAERKARILAREAEINAAQATPEWKAAYAKAMATPSPNDAIYARVKAQTESAAAANLATVTKNTGLTASNDGYYNMKNDSTGGSGVFSGAALQQALKDGWGAASAPTDYSKLGANSVYRPENAANVGSAPVPYANMINTPTAYKAPDTMMAEKAPQVQPQPDFASMISQEFSKQNQLQQSQQATQAAAQQTERQRVEQQAAADKIQSENYIKQLKQAQIDNNVAGLDKQKNGMLSNLSSEQSLIQPAAYADRNKANVGMNNANNSWNEFMAQKYGSSKSGIEGLGVGLNLNQYQGQVGSINSDATAKEADISRRTTDVNNNYLSDVQAAKSGAEATALQNQLNQYNTDKNFNYQANQDSISNANNNRNFNYQVGQDSINNANNDRNFNYQSGQDKISNANTIANTESTVASNKLKAITNEANLVSQANYKDITAEINRRTTINANDPLIPYLQAARTAKIENQKAVELKAKEVKTAAQQQIYDNAMVAWKESGVATQQMSKILGVPVGANTASYNIDNINAAISRSQVSISQQNANTNSSQLAWAKDPKNPDNIAKIKLNTSTTNTVDDYASTINSLYVQTPNSDNGYVSSMDKKSIRAYLVDLVTQGVDASIVDSLAARYGVK